MFRGLSEPTLDIELHDLSPGKTLPFHPLIYLLDMIYNIYK